MTEPRTHYQLTFTARQAVGGFLGLLLSLGLAFGIGLIAGLRRAPAEQEGAAPVPTPETVASADSVEPARDGFPAVETAVPTAAASGPLGSRTEIFGATVSGATPPPPSDPTPPATLQTFQDGSSEAAESSGEGESSPIASASGGSGPVASRPANSAPSTSSSGKYWVQVASLSSREEAGSLSSRLSRHGFRSQVLTASGPKGKGKVYRVRVGPYRSEDDAEKAATKLARQEKVKSPWVVPDGM